MLQPDTAAISEFKNLMSVVLQRETIEEREMLVLTIVMKHGCGQFALTVGKVSS